MNGIFLPTPELLVKMPVEKLTKMKKEELINFVAEVRTSYADSNAATQSSIRADRRPSEGSAGSQKQPTRQPLLP